MRIMCRWQQWRFCACSQNRVIDRWLQTSCILLYLWFPWNLVEPWKPSEDLLLWITAKHTTLEPGFFNRFKIDPLGVFDVYILVRKVLNREHCSNWVFLSSLVFLHQNLFPFTIELKLSCKWERLLFSSWKFENYLHNYFSYSPFL